MNRMRVSLYVSVLACSLSIHGYASEHREHGPHEHGAANLNVALDGKQLAVELTSPAVNIVGFEHAPGTADEEARVKQSAATLEDGARLFGLPVEADCRLQDTDVDSELLDAHHGDYDGHHGKEDDERHEHSEFHASYTFRCEDPAALTDMDVKLFDLFPGTQRLIVQYITPSSQGGVDLHPGSSRLSF